MDMGKTQLHVVNSHIRRLFQKHYEFGIIKKHLRKNQIDLDGKVILDAGCGSGYGTELILNEFHPEELHALDAMPEQIELLKQRKLPMTATVGDIADTEFGSNKFDAVFAFGVFHHVPEWQKAIEEVKRVLKPGGVLVGGEIAKKGEAGDFEWITFAKDLERAGFKILEDERIYFGYFRSFICMKPTPPAGSTADTPSQSATAPNRTAPQWLLLAALVFAIILIPFFLFGPQMEVWTEHFIESATRQSGWVAVVLGSLLALDILLPVPSSLTSTATGLLGFVKGLITSLAGMTISCVIGFWLGAKFGRSAARRIVGDSELKRLEELSSRFGNWAIVIARPVPVLAEASVVFAGMSGVPMYQFLLLSTLSNLGISAVYAAVGALSATTNSFLLAFAGSILLPLVAMLATGRRTTAKGTEKAQG